MTEWNRAYRWHMWCPECGPDGEAWHCRGSDARGGGQHDPYAYLLAHVVIHLVSEHGLDEARATNLLATAPEHWETVGPDGERREATSPVIDLDRVAELVRRIVDE